MLIIGLIIAACLYALLYWIYLLADSQLTSATTTLAVINKMLFMPEPSVFFILRGLIIITFFYVIADALLMTPARRSLKKRKQRRLDAEYEKKAFRGVKPAPSPPPDDDLAPHY